MIRIILILLAIAVSNGAFAQSWYSPQRGSVERQQLVDGLRPFAEFVLGPPVEFVISELRVAGDVAFISARAQRPGGGQIAPYDTPQARRGGHDPVAGNLDSYHAFYKRKHGVWIVQDRSVDAQDVWWADPRMCVDYAAVTPEVC